MSGAITTQQFQCCLVPGRSCSGTRSVSRFILAKTRFASTQARTKRANSGQPPSTAARALSPSPRLATRIQKRQVGRAEHGLEICRSNPNLLKYLPASKVTDALRSEPLILHPFAEFRSNHHQITEKIIACWLLVVACLFKSLRKGSRGTYEPAYTAQLEADSSSLVEQMFSRLQQWST